MEAVKSMKNTAQAIKNRECRKSARNGTGPGFGGILESFWSSILWKICFLVEKVSARKQTETKYPKKWNWSSWLWPRAPWQPALKSKIEQQLNNKQQQFNNSTKTLTVAESLLQFDSFVLCVFDFRFKMMWLLFLVGFQIQGQWSDTPWARPGEFSHPFLVAASRTESLRLDPITCT